MFNKEKHYQAFQIREILDYYIVTLSKIVSIRGNEIHLPSMKIPIGRSFKRKLIDTIKQSMG